MIIGTAAVIPSRNATMCLALDILLKKGINFSLRKLFSFFSDIFLTPTTSLKAIMQSLTYKYSHFVSKSQLFYETRFKKGSKNLIIIARKKL